jgi:type IV pilus assembly protein PilW
MKPATRIRQTGLSLVEVMVAVAIGMIGIVIIMQAYLTADRFNRSTLGEGGAQTNGLIALYSVERDVRMAGYGLSNSGVLGCGQIYWYFDPNYSSNIGGGTLPNITLAPVLITADTVTPSNPDRVTLMYSTAGERMIPSTITSFNAKSSEVSVDGTDGFKPGNLVLMVNGGGCTLGKITQVQGVAQKIQLNPGVSAPHNPPAWGSFPTTYNSGDAILNLGDPVVRTYQINITTGKLQVSESLFSTGASPAVDLVDGIIDMRALYGKDDGSVAGTTANDGIVDVYNNTTPTTGAQWLQVLAVRIGMLARIGNYERPSVSGGNCDATTVAPTWSGGNFPAVDIATVTSQDRCYRYRVFETTVPLRNMIWRIS